MNIPFNTAVIVGSSRGIGRGIAVKLAKEGVRKIAVHYRTRRKEAETTLSQLKDAGAAGVLVQGDVLSKFLLQILGIARQKLPKNESVMISKTGRSPILAVVLEYRAITARSSNL